MTEYKIVHDQSLSLLASRVNQEIKAGWQPLGGPFFNPDHGAYDQFNQAMIKIHQPPNQWTEGGYIAR